MMRRAGRQKGAPSEDDGGVIMWSPEALYCAMLNGDLKFAESPLKV